MSLDYNLNQKLKHNGFINLLRVTLFLIIFPHFGGMCVFAQSSRITLDIENVSLETVLSKIEDQTDYHFLYNKEIVDVRKKISIHLNNEPIKQALDKIFEGQGISYLIEKRQIVLNKDDKPYGTENLKIIVKGKILDQKDEPVIGASVQQIGTSTGTVSNDRGEFSLSVNKNSMLDVSCIGYINKRVRASNENIIVHLDDDNELLDEVVVIGYGTMKKKDLMGANSVLSGDNLTTNSSISVGGALQGKMSGLSILSSSGFPGSETSIRIRGVNTFGSGDSSPLVVIDGIPVDQGFETLNPNDIESVNVMKDASSAAIYGSRAANGVILINTKNGRSGMAKVSANLTYGVQMPSHLMNMLDAMEFVSIIQEMRDNYNAIYKPTAGKEATTRYDDLDPKSFGKGTKWTDYIYDSAPTLNVNASVTGGNESLNYYISGEYMDQDGIAINTSYKKSSFRANIVGNVKKYLRIGNNAHLAYRKAEGSSDFRYSDVVFNAPVTPAYDEDGSYGEPNTSLTGSRNAIAEVAWYTPHNDSYRVLDNMFLEVNFTDWLKFRFNGGIDFVFNESRSFKPIFSDGGVTNSENSYSENRSKDLMWVTDYLLYFDKKIQKHAINAMAGFSQQLYSGDNLYGSIKNFVSESKNMQVMDGGTDTKERVLSGGKYQLALASYFGRINYDYDSRYLFSFNLRVDGSSRFKDDNIWGVFPSFSGAWRISEEDFFDVQYISTLKLRASWGQLGNQSIGSYYPTVAPVSKLTSVFGPSADDQTLYSGYSQTVLGNKNLKWETTTVTNLGLDLNLFDDKLTIIADYFIKNTDGILRTMVLPPSVGMTAPNTNYAKVLNRGFDLEIGYKSSISKFNYSISGNVSFLHNKIRKLSSGVNEEVINIGSYGGVTINRVGEPISALYGYKTDGVITSEEEASKYKSMGQGNAKIGRLKYVDENKDGIIDINDRVILGSYIPKITAGLTFSADWNNFDLNFVLDGVFGRKQHAPMSYQNRFPNRNISHKWYDHRYILGASGGNYPAMIQNESYEEMTDLMAMNTSFAKLRSFTLGYSFKLNGISSRIFLSGENLFTFTSDEFDGFDPENGNSVGHYTNWGDDYPTPRIYLVGLNINF